LFFEYVASLDPYNEDKIKFSATGSILLSFLGADENGPWVLKKLLKNLNFFADVNDLLPVKIPLFEEPVCFSIPTNFSIQNIPAAARILCVTVVTDSYVPLPTTQRKEQDYTALPP